MSCGSVIGDGLRFVRDTVTGSWERSPVVPDYIGCAQMSSLAKLYVNRLQFEGAGAYEPRVLVSAATGGDQKNDLDGPVGTVMVEVRIPPERYVAIGRVASGRGAVGTFVSALAVVGPLCDVAIARGPLGEDPVGESLTESAPTVDNPTARGTWTKLRRIARGLSHTRQWRVGVAMASNQVDAALAGRPLAPVRWLPGSGYLTFWADPCPATFKESEWIFAERYSRPRGNGQIIAIDLSGQNSPRVVLGGRHHRALPRVQQIGGRWIATSDTCESPHPVFTFDELGGPWRPLPGAFLPAGLTDPELVYEPAEWSVYGTNWHFDESAVRQRWVSRVGPPFSWEPDHGWTAVDAATSRGAGNVDPRRRIRSVQDCSGGYGMAVHLVDLDEVGLDANFATIDSSSVTAVGGTPSPSGIHTFAWNPDESIVAIDGWWLRRDPLAGLWRLMELRHLKRCRERQVALARELT